MTIINLRRERTDQTVNGITNIGDRILTGSGNDTITGLAGDDTIISGAGNDSIDAGQGNNFVRAETGDNVILSGDGDDILTAGNGNQTFNSSGGNNRIMAGDGNHQVTVGSGDDTISLGRGTHSINAGDGDNNIRIAGGHATIATGSGSDTISVYRGAGTVSTGAGDDAVRGGKGDDIIDGGAGDDTIRGGKGDDSIDGSAGDDRLKGGSGDDTMRGGDGNDMLSAGAGDDMVYVTYEENGSQGLDRAIGGKGSDTLVIELADPAEWFDGTVQQAVAALQAEFDAPDYDSDRFTTSELFGVTFRSFENVAVSVDGQLLDTVNDPVTANDDSYAVNEDASITGSVLGNDIAPDLVKNVSLVSGPSAGALTLKADGSFAFDAAGSFDYLADGKNITVEFTYEVEDADGSTDQATATITVNGQNDVPTIGGTTTGVVEEDGQLNASGTLTITDPDIGESSFQSQTNVIGDYGTFNLGSDGNWTYTLDNNNTAVQALGEGDTLTDDFVFLSSDGSAQDSVIIQIDGADEAPIGNDFDVVEMTGRYQFGFTDWNAFSPFGDINNLEQLDLVTTLLTNGYTFSAPRGTDFANVNGVYNFGSAVNTMTFEFAGGAKTVDTFNFVSSRAYGTSLIEIEARDSGGAWQPIFEGTSREIGITTGQARAYQLDVTDTHTDALKLTISGSTGNQVSLHEVAVNEDLTYLL